MAKPKLFNYIAAAVIAFLLILWYYQNKQPGPRLFPGEHVDTNYSVPVIASVRDAKCSTTAECPTNTSESVTRKFTVVKDTVYFLTVGYYNGDTLHASCHACATVYRGDLAVAIAMTRCPGGQLVTAAPLKPGVDYTLVVNLLGCPKTDACECGKNAKADAAVSMRRIN